MNFDNIIFSFYSIITPDLLDTFEWQLLLAMC